MFSYETYYSHIESNTCYTITIMQCIYFLLTDYQRVWTIDFKSWFQIFHLHIIMNAI